jgi:hypothetical protein
MVSRLDGLFEDKDLVQKIKRRLPYLFQIAELECSRAGKIGMEVGSTREKVIIALLINKFMESNVETQIPITEPEVDVKLYGNPISIKTITGTSFGRVKLIWTVDPDKAMEFRNAYNPTCDILLIQINWGGDGGFFYVSKEIQKNLVRRIGRKNYILLPKQGTNPRGVEITKSALTTLIKDPGTKRIEIEWKKVEIEYDPYKRWVDLWNEDR